MKIIIANWKDNPATLDEAKELFRIESASAAKYTNIKTVIYPPIEYLDELMKLGGELGGQDVVSGFGIKYVLAGHSDRRYGLGETDEIINTKIKTALAAGLTPILLVGERERADSRERAIADQLSLDLAGLPNSDVSKVMICYEPVWAISTNPNAEADKPENTLEAIGFISDFMFKAYNLKPETCLYGGSITSANVVSFLSHPEIGGAIVGGASLNPDEFAKILNLTDTVSS